VSLVDETDRQVGSALDRELCKRWLDMH